ncbi:hypothetical protein EUTSA_v10029328mg [Eutrema salsugineum]|uniref:Uncharacterized protein n=1 Tax=Eutrema salsugineum TaxID=72664 RepID=V4KL68_EUTSA|nr:hypothetical protein EUTSA_v10029328mg [Eutrema salsugineum]
MRKLQRSTQSSHDDNDRSQSHDDNDGSQSRDHIPLDLIVEILVKLPAKSIGRYRSVSKLCSSITTTPRSSTRSRAAFCKRDKLFVFSSPLHKITCYPDQAENYQYTIPNNGCFRRYDSVHGLVYLETYTELTIWNPTMKRFFTLPKPQGSQGRYQTGFLGYDPIDCKYKALCILTGNKIGILTLGGQESWKILSEGFPRHSCIIKDCGKCINGVMYYDCYFEKKCAIMSFDLRSEKFSLIKFPMDKYCRGSLFVSYEGRLALIISSIDGVELWILEDAENHQWVYKHIHSPNLPYTRWTMKEWTLKGVTDVGEFIYIYTPSATYRSPTELSSSNWRLYEWFHIVYFDPKRNGLREVKFPGIAYDEFKQLGEVRYDLLNDSSVVPNHIESLMSL